MWARQINQEPLVEAGDDHLREKVVGVHQVVVDAERVLSCGRKDLVERVVIAVRRIIVSRAEVVSGTEPGLPRQVGNLQPDFGGEGAGEVIPIEPIARLNGAPEQPVDLPDIGPDQPNGMTADQNRMSWRRLHRLHYPLEPSPNARHRRSCRRAETRRETRGSHCAR